MHLTKKVIKLIKSYLKETMDSIRKWLNKPKVSEVNESYIYIMLISNQHNTIFANVMFLQIMCANY